MGLLVQVEVAESLALGSKGGREGGIIIIRAAGGRVTTATGDIWQCGRSQFCGAVLYIPKGEGRTSAGESCGSKRCGGGDVFPPQAYN